MGISTLIAILSVFALVLFICAPARQSYFIIAMMQTIAGKGTIFMIISGEYLHIICRPMYETAPVTLKN